MILQFSVSNFRCFRKLQTLNLAASSQDKSLPDNCIITNLPGLSGKTWIKGVALYGANASGKTTLLKALAALAEMVKTSAKLTDPKEPIPQIESFGLATGEPESPTAFGVSFVADGMRYEYRVAATKQRVLHESLRCFPKAKEQLWFSRDWIPDSGKSDSGQYAWSPERPTGFQRDTQLEGYTLSNMLFLSKAVASNRSELEPVFRWFKDRLIFLDLSDRRRMGFVATLQQFKTETPLCGRIVELLRHADLGLTGARAIEQLQPEDFPTTKDPEAAALFRELDKLLNQIVARAGKEAEVSYNQNRRLQPELDHRGSHEVNVSLPWNSESAGTHQMFALAGTWLDILSNGQTVCVDELETSLHPLIVRELLRLFFSATENQKGAQILFTTHNPLLLDTTLLRRDQIWFTDKEADGEAHLYPLTDYQPRKGESLVRGYLSGRYGALPFVPTGLLGTVPPHEIVGKSEKGAHE
jgi:AAA15 family ATPase/GTPase